MDLFFGTIRGKGTKGKRMMKKGGRNEGEVVWEMQHDSLCVNVYQITTLSVGNEDWYNNNGLLSG